jgi:hypothetical protein
MVSKKFRKNLRKFSQVRAILRQARAVFAAAVPTSVVVPAPMAPALGIANIAPAPTALDAGAGLGSTSAGAVADAADAGSSLGSSAAAALLSPTAAAAAAASPFASQTLTLHARVDSALPDAAAGASTSTGTVLSPERDRAPANINTNAAASVVASPPGGLTALFASKAHASKEPPARAAVVITLAAEIAALARAESQMDASDRAVASVRHAREWRGLDTQMASQSSGLAPHGKRREYFFNKTKNHQPFYGHTGH